MNYNAKFMSECREQYAHRSIVNVDTTEAALCFSGEHPACYHQQLTTSKLSQAGYQLCNIELFVGPGNSNCFVLGDPLDTNR